MNIRKVVRTYGMVIIHTNYIANLRGEDHTIPIRGVYLNLHTHLQYRTRLTPMVRRDIFFCYFVLILRSALRTIYGSPAAHHWPEKSADHGSRRLLPLASPMGRRRPNHTYRPHPHIMGEHAYARFWHPTCRGQEIWYDRHRLNVLHY